MHYGSWTDGQTISKPGVTVVPKKCHTLNTCIVKRSKTWGQNKHGKCTEFAYMLILYSVVAQEESPCLRGSSGNNLQVLVLVLVLDLSPCPWTTKSAKIVKDFTFCKQSVMYHPVVHKFGYRHCAWGYRTAKNVLLTDITYYLLIFISK